MTKQLHLASILQNILHDGGVNQMYNVEDKLAVIIYSNIAISTISNALYGLEASIDVSKLQAKNRILKDLGSHQAA